MTVMIQESSILLAVLRVYESVEESDEGNEEVVDSRHSTLSDEKFPTVILLFLTHVM